MFVWTVNRHCTLGMHPGALEVSGLPVGVRERVMRHQEQCRILDLRCKREQLLAELPGRLVLGPRQPVLPQAPDHRDRKSTRLNSSHSQISYAVFCLKKKKD